uniref:hypothetical protein n=1 Tax=Symbiobacterium terraclitae TaxID=557451 RepID=UPI0035B508CF
TASYEGLEPASIEIEIVPGPIANVVGATKSVAPGTAVKLIAVDQYGNKVEGATFAEAEDYAKAFVEGDQFIATEAGTYKIVATKGEETAEGTISVFGEHAGFDIIIEDELVANGATEYEVKVVAVDEDGNAVTDFDGEVVLETNLDLVSDAQLKAKDGVATFKVKVPVGMDGLEADFTATYTNADEDIEIEASESFEIKAQVATKIELKADKYLAINDPAFSGSVKILDQLGKPMESGETFDVTLTISGPAYFEDTTDKELVVEASGGSLPFAIEPVDKFSEGTITITATAEGLTSATAEVTAAFAMAPKALTINNDTTSARKAGTTNAQAWTFKVGLTDKNGVPVRADDDYEVTLVFDHDDADEELTVTIDGKPVVLDDGEVKAILAGPTATDPGAKELVVSVKSEGIVGDVKVTAKAKDLTSASNTISFKAGDLAQIAFTKDTSTTPLNVLNDTEYELVAQLQDEAGNPVAKSGVKVVFEAANDKEYVNLGRGFGKSFTTYTDAEGKATVKVRVLDYKTNFAITADAESDDFTGSATVNLQVVKSVAKSISVSTYVYNEDTGKWESKSSVEAGQKVQVRAKVTDQRGMTAGSTYEGTLKLGGIKKSEIGDVVDDSDLTDLPDFAWDNEYGWYVAFTARKAKTYSLTVSDKSSATEVKGTRGFTVVAGIAEAVDFDGDEIKYVKGESKEVVLNVVDKYGNKVPASKVTSQRITAIGTVTVTLETNSADPKIYGIVSKTKNGGGTDSLELELKQYTNTYKVYIVTNADSGAELLITGRPDPIKLVLAD